MTKDSTQVDMLAFARFAVLPGANRLIDAFSGIPEGPLRESVIHMAETLKATYAGAPADLQMPDPIAKIGEPKQLPASRTGREPKTSSPEMDVVKLRMSGLSVVEITRKTGIPKDTIYNAIKDARAAGLKVPRGNTGVPLKGQGSAEGTWHTSLDTISLQGRVQVAKAARDRGITPEAYMARRQLALQLAQEGASYETILEQTGEKEAKHVSAWLSNARGAGHNVPYVTFLKPDAAKDWTKPEADPEPEPEPVVDAVVAPVGRVFPPASEVAIHVRMVIQKAAARRGMTVQAYEELRESIVRHRMDGKQPSEIAQMTGEPRFFVRDILDAARDRGVTFPDNVAGVESESLRKATG